MASIVKHYDKRTGITYVYESESYWDKEKKQPRNRRKMIGKIDPITGEIVPNGPRGRRKKEAAESTSAGVSSGLNSSQASSSGGDYEKQLLEKDLRIRQLTQENAALTAQNERLKKQYLLLMKDLKDITRRYDCMDSSTE